MAARLTRLSVSTRLALWYGLSLLVLLGLFVVFLYTSIHWGLHADFEAQLRRDESYVVDAIQERSGVPALDEERVLTNVAIRTKGPSGAFVRLLSPEGELLYRSPNLDGMETLPAARFPDGASATVSRTWTSAPARTRYARIPGIDSSEIGWVEVTRLESSLHDELHRLRWLLAFGVVFGSGVAVAMGYHMSRRALRPVSEMITAARAMGRDPTGAATQDGPPVETRLPTEFGVRDELTELSETINGLLERLDVSIRRERRFRADAAHELMTPIAALRSELDVAARRPRDAAYYEASASTLEDHVDRLTRLVDGLLHLSRAEEHDVQEPEGCDVFSTIEEVCLRLESLASARGVTLRFRGQPGPKVAMDQVSLETVVENLIDNAVKYTPAGGSVTVGLTKRSDHVHLTVADTGVGLTGDEQARLFDRFFRSDRVRSIRGSGLGLSIAVAIVEAYAGSITATSQGPNEGTRVEVTLPRDRGAAMMRKVSDGRRSFEPDRN